ncbi:zinc ribbon domain-containing protein [candidate division WOR-3 bacterium]|nr:zinc ribbon domain-containing protein [candidate division WOR-3 bacterium]
MKDKWQELRELEAERSDIITKLEKIEEKKESVSLGVYKKVKNEYERKLRKIDEKMVENVDLVKEELINLNQEEERVVQEEKEINFKIEELELRYSIGEYDEESFEKLSDENKEKLVTAKTNLQKLQERKQWLEDFVKIKNVEETIESKTPVTTPEATPEVIPEVIPQADIKIDEHILEEKLPGEDKKLDELLVEEEAVIPKVPEEQQAAAPEVSPESDGEQEKSTPCPKCGYMNAPDSWYCEKCGAEILDSQASK